MKGTLTARRLVWSELGIGLLALVVPVLLGHGINALRIDRAQRDVAAIAAAMETRLQPGHPEPEVWSGGAGGAHVLLGPGNPPDPSRLDDAASWTAATVDDLQAVLGSQALTADPWGNQYLVLLRPGAAGEPSRFVVVSAGVNGQLETTAAGQVGGDDVAAPGPGAVGGGSR